MWRWTLAIFCFAMSTVQAASFTCMAQPQYDDPQEVYRELYKQYQGKHYKQVAFLGNRLITYHADSPVLANTYFYYGVALFHLAEYAKANTVFSTFLDQYALPQFFEETMQYKFAIAEKFRQGERKRILGIPYAPKWENATEDAIDIYNEVIMTLNRDEIAIEAQYHKAGLLVVNNQWKEGIECYQSLIRKYPKHPLSAESYLAVARVYAQQAKIRHPDVQIVELAEMNFKRFLVDYPTSQSLRDMEGLLVSVKDRFAKELWDSADFFVRKKNSVASAVLYYKLLIQKYPETSYAMGAVNQLHAWKSAYPEDIASFLDNSPIAASP